MSMYTFHMCNADNSSGTFEAFELEADSDTYPRAGRLLTEHPSAIYVSVWEGDRPVLIRSREAPFRLPATRPAQLHLIK